MDPFPSSGRVLPPNSSGIKVIIVGCDIAGLGCAIECARKGHKVVVLEKCTSKTKSSDEVVTLTANAARFIERWGLHDSLHSIRIRSNSLHADNHLGEPTPPDRYGTPKNQIHKLLRAQALSLGAEIRTGHNVIAYRQSEVTRKAGVILDNGEGIEGHLVVSVGVGRTSIPGEEKKRTSSRHAIHRPWSDARDHSDRVTEFSYNTGGDVAYARAGPDSQCSLGGKAASSTHSYRDEADHKDDAMGLDGRGAHHAAVSLSSKAPSASIMGWAYRDPLPTRIKGRVLIIGDAFELSPPNPHDPSQAIEDGVVLAVTLQLAGKHNVSLAVKAWERIRYQRRMRLINKATRGKRRGDATSGPGGDDATSTPGGDGPDRWLFAFNAEKDVYDFDPEKDAYECYPKVMLRLLEESEFGGRGEPVTWL